MSTLPLLLALLAAPAPGDSELASPTAPEINPLLAKVPAGTPYFIVTRERPPRPAMVALLQRHGGGWTEGMESFVLRLSALIALSRASAPGSSPDGDERRERILAVLPKSLDAPALATLGLRPDAHFAFYAKKSGVPVLRLEIAEREAFLAFLERLLAAMEWEAGRETVGDGEWLRLPFPPRQPELIAHLLVGERDVALALATPDLPAERLAELFAAPPPGGDLAASGRLETLASLHGFTGPFYGQLDFKALFSELRLVQMNEIFATCVEEFSRETEQAESLDLGMYRFDTRGLRLGIAARVHPELRQEFESEIVPLPERPEAEALFELVVALRIGSGFEPPTGTPKEPAGRVYRCPLLEDLNAVHGLDRISSPPSPAGPLGRPRDPC
ncbi:MAG: hypothetical protein RML12_08720 [Xanthomonadales bacterium]|nr:hypothetical protein [Xanthomonadales bacterium]